MDKRYFLIIMIIIVCCFSLYNIAIHSDVIGSATVQCGKYTCSLPNGFSLYDSESNQIDCRNDNGTYIHIYTDLAEGSNYTNKYNELNQSNEYHILSNGSINYNNITIHSIFYSQENDGNRSTFYFSKDNASFRIIIVGYDYDTQQNETINIACNIADSMKLNYKQ